MRNDGGPAFPTEFGFNSEGEKWDRRGMSLRDYFAAAALPQCQSVVFEVGPKVEKPTTARIASMCYEQADAMLAERENP